MRQVAGVLPFAVGGRQRLAIDHGNHFIDAGFDATVEISRFEMRRHVFVDDAVCDRIGNRALQTGADFDAHAPVIFCDDQDRAVIDPFAAQLPCIAHTNAELLDFLRLRAGNDEHSQLAALLGFERRKFRLDARHRGAGQGAGQIRYPPGKRRHGDVGVNGPGGEQQDQECGQR